MGFIEEELAAVRSEIRGIPYTELITCHPAMVQVKVRLVLYCTPSDSIWSSLCKLSVSLIDIIS